MNDPNQNPNSPSQNHTLTRYRVINFIEDQMRSGQLLAEALRPWPDENGDYYAVRTLEDWWYAFQKGGFPALQPAIRSDHGKHRALDEATATWVLEQMAQNPSVKFKVLYQHWKKQGRSLPSISVLYRFLRRQGYDLKSLRSGRLETGPTKAFEAPSVNDLWTCLPAGRWSIFHRDPPFRSKARSWSLICACSSMIIQACFLLPVTMGMPTPKPFITRSRKRCCAGDCPASSTPTRASPSAALKHWGARAVPFSDNAGEAPFLSPAWEQALGLLQLQRLGASRAGFPDDENGAFGNPALVCAQGRNDASPCVENYAGVESVAALGEGMGETGSDGRRGVGGVGHALRGGIDGCAGLDHAEHTARGQGGCRHTQENPGRAQSCGKIRLKPWFPPLKVLEVPLQSGNRPPL